MKIFDMVADILYAIKIKKIPVKDYCNYFFLSNNISKEDKKYVVKIVNFYVRHFMLIDFAIKDNFPLISKEDIFFYLIAYYFISFKYMKEDISVEEIDNDLLESLYTPTYVDTTSFSQKIRAFCTQNKYLENKTLSKLEKNLLILNIPYDVFVKLHDSFSRDELNNLIKPNFQYKQALAININKCHLEDFVNDDRFEIIKSENKMFDSYGILILKQKILPSELKEVVDGKLFVLDFSIFKALDDINYHSFDDIMQITATSGNLCSYYSIINNMNNGRSLACFLDDRSLARSKALFERLGVDCETLICKELRFIKNEVEFDSKDVVICTPPNSNIGMFKRSGDVLFNFSLETAEMRAKDVIKEYLEESSYFVKPNGRLFFMVRSFLDFETTERIEEFVKNHPEFTLIKEKQILSYEFNSDSLYYAILKRAS